ncbi:unnamed protein product [Schistosoma turkestanicum]|nr:unnamed protein product [Schistosoma turkestanicum]
MRIQLLELFSLLMLTIMIVLMVDVHSFTEEQNSYEHLYEPLYEYRDYINQETIPNKRYIRFGKRGANYVMRYGDIPTLTRHKTHSFYDFSRERQ